MLTIGNFMKLVVDVIHDPIYYTCSAHSYPAKSMWNLRDSFEPNRFKKVPSKAKSGVKLHFTSTRAHPLSIIRHG